MAPVRPKVLVIDYDEENLILLERLLENEGFDTTTTWTGLDAFKALVGETFDLVLVADYLPGMNAEQFMRELRHAARDGCCIVMQSSQAAPRARRPFGPALAVEVVAKMSPAKVVEVVRSHRRLQRGRAAS